MLYFLQLEYILQISGISFALSLSLSFILFSLSLNAQKQETGQIVLMMMNGRASQQQAAMEIHTSLNVTTAKKRKKSQHILYHCMVPRRE
jgi:hypothetical protein